LICPPKISRNSCECETIVETSPIQVCHSGILEFGQCISTAHPKEYCPIGSYLQPETRLCIHREVEPAVCLFSVTYMCPDCEHFPPPPFNHQHLPYHHTPIHYDLPTGDVIWRHQGETEEEEDTTEVE